MSIAEEIYLKTRKMIERIFCDSLAGVKVPFKPAAQKEDEIIDAIQSAIDEAQAELQEDHAHELLERDGLVFKDRERIAELEKVAKKAFVAYEHHQDLIASSEYDGEALADADTKFHDSMDALKGE